MDSVEWGPVGAWAGVLMTAVIAGISILVARGWFDRFNAPELAVGFEPAEPWLRPFHHGDGTVTLWIRVSVTNTGRSPARGCIGRLTAVATDGSPRADVDPLQLRWAGVPKGVAFEPVDLRPGQREFLNVVRRGADGDWDLVTFESPDFEPGFALDLLSDHSHVIAVTVFADSASTSALLHLSVVAGREPRLSLSHQ